MTELNLPLVTIMIPTYNQAQVLPRAIQSALSQTYSNIEVLVSDDNSTDNTSEVMKKFSNDNRIRYVRHTKSLGRVGNYRKMIFELARGQWLLNVDGDDFLTDSRFIEDAIEIAKKNPELVLVFARQKYLNAQTGMETVHPAPSFPDQQSGLDLFFNYPMIPEGMPHIGSLYRKDIAIKADVQSEDIITSDSESLLRIIVHGSVAYMNRVVGCWVEHNSNESGKLSFEKRWSSLRMALGPASYLDSLGLAPSEKIEKWKTEMLSRLIRENLSLYLDRSDWEGYLKFFSEAQKNFGKPAWKANLSKSVLLRLLIPGFSKHKPRLLKLVRKQNAKQ